MDQALKEYIASLKPEGFPDGNALVKEGMEMAKDIPWNKSRFLKEYGYESHLEYRKKKSGGGKADIPAADGTFDAGRRTRGH